MTPNARVWLTTPRGWRIRHDAHWRSYKRALRETYAMQAIWAAVGGSN